MNGLLKIDKEAGYASHDIDNLVKRTLDLPKVGHLGTLDPFATGLLIVGVGDGTKILPFIPDDWKTYEATLQLFKTTDSLDLTGHLIATEPARDIPIEEIRQALQTLGQLKEEVPPSVCARHIDGERAYDLIRDGFTVVLPPSPIAIQELTLLDWNPKQQQITFKATVSKGTYLRALGRDLAKLLNTVGYLTALRRTAISSLDLSGAVKIKDLTPEHLLPLDALIPQIPKIEVRDRIFEKAYNGVDLPFDGQTAHILFLTHEKEPVALYKRNGKVYTCYRGFNHELSNRYPD
jgi:tRNA pseudouridine55 synthase